MWYNCNCLDEQTTGALCFSEAADGYHNFVIVGKAPSMCGLTSPAVRLGNGSAHGGRFDMSIKHCVKCDTAKPITDFHKDKNRKDGRHVYCKACVKEYHLRNKEKLSAITTEWQRNNPIRYKEYQDTYSRLHREKTNTRQSAYARAHPEIVREKSRIRREKDREYNRLQTSLWAKRHPHKDRARVQRRRARVKGCSGSFTGEEWAELCERYGNKCLRCGSEGNMTIDHVIPIALGGSNTIDNIQPLCKKCNSGKGARIIDYRRDFSRGLD